MKKTDLQKNIEKFWGEKESINQGNKDLTKTINLVLDQLDRGIIRICDKNNGEWVTHEWIKKAILMSFKVNDNSIFSSGISNSRGGQYTWFDKVNLKTSGWVEDEWTKRSFRSVPGAIVRYSSHIAENVVLMPCFINLGAYVDSGTMIDTWATVGSCAQIGKNVHISGGAGIGGVLEPLQAGPVIIEDNCFVGARSEVAEGVVVEEGSVLSMGVYIGASTKIIDRSTGETFLGRVPSYSVVVPGSINKNQGSSDIISPNLYCAVIVKRVDAQTRSKTSVNELLRD